MGRPRRMKSRGAIYHVYSRGNRRQMIFPEFADYQTFEKMLLEKTEACHIGLFGWCLMPNHIHLVVETPEANLSQFMQQLLTSYARYMNRKYKLVGHVFQGRFGSSYCDRKKYFLKLLCYIHLNPVQTKTPLCDRPEDWRWSSHRHYLSSSERPAPMQATIESTLTRFFSPLPEKAIRRYRQFIEAGLNDKGAQDVLKMKILGDEEFIKGIKASLVGKNGATRIELGPNFSVSLANLAEITVRCFQISIKELVGSDYKGNLGRIRKAFICVARKECHISVTELARILNRDPSAMSHAVKRIKVDKASTETGEVRYSPVSRH